ncbi:sirohydrochlorin chelatase [Arcobacter sp. CECT 8985]|uniref:sirohydrochlorin chelatase n=1 Tax=Arcobacter sp. CECT 8985 TaxID=1935424 RepID=UPI00100AA5A7|nr:CbiX/SirB N-terminal domain-containing protein [Arcobacter sp. CECT 8985]RXJ87615.1 hypothetical protein CRU93_03535 [Arcobacter sp. CECT 8985]
MNSLILIAHGSRLESSNKEVIRLVKKLKEQNNSKNLNIGYSFLELTEPSIEDSVKKQILLGSKKITLLPYFLAEGKHVKDDIPKEVNYLKNKYKDIDFELLPHLGANNGIINLILSCV